MRCTKISSFALLLLVATFLGVSTGCGGEEENVVVSGTTDLSEEEMAEEEAGVGGVVDENY